MNVTITPSPLHGTVTAPPSKSMAHRLLICGGLAAGKTSTIHGISDSDDVSATLACLSAIGAICQKHGDTVEITGTDIRHIEPDAVLNCHESGSTLRFFIPLCLMCGKEISLTGTRKLLSRPLNVYETICKEQNIEYQHTDNTVTVCGRLAAREYKIPGNISSQFISGLLFALPLCGGDSIISIIPPIESRSYLDLTLDRKSVV